MARSIAPICCLIVAASAQQEGALEQECLPDLTLEVCTKSGGCVPSRKRMTMDAQWRWMHDARKDKYKNCISGTPPAWDTGICDSDQACAAGCALEGITKQDYEHTYGVKEARGGVELKFKTGEAIGSRVYMMKDEEHYEMFKLLNKEFTLDVDSSTLECGMNGAVYFVEMDEDGEKSKGDNTAGAKLGTGYCDAQCPHDMKFIEGAANFKGWHEEKWGPEGHWGVCCAEMDIWEANKHATAFTTHACDNKGPLKCEGFKCGDTPADCKCCGEAECDCCGRYKGVCDKDGCDYNHFRLGDEDFYGSGSNFKVDSSKPITVVTQFLTHDGTDTGDLVEIRRLYVQDGKLINNSKVKNLDGFAGDSINEKMCLAQKRSFDNPDDFTPKGGMKGMGAALGRGMVLVLSLWDDMKTQMVWLDSAAPTDQPDRFPLTKPGVRRGPCKNGDGDPHKLRANYPDAFVTYRSIKVGEIGSTYLDKLEHTGSGGSAGSPSGSPSRRRSPSSDTRRRRSPSSNGGGHSPTPSSFAEPECCTASLEANDPCMTCWRGAALATGWCATKDHCEGGCGGTWCPNGAVKALFEQPAETPAVISSGGAGRPILPTLGLAGAAALALPALAAAALWRARRPRAAADATAGGAPASYAQLQPGGTTA
mmetsp:Transcript_61396/g.190308  ORF Transcript_61396/g.190308 Transcript_61396/m.190308 type:complete len:650 (+) Transcript_61396:68-2017(+)